MQMRDTVTAERLRQVLDYNPETGIFIWRVQLAQRGKKGTVAGSRRKDGRITIRVDTILYMAHRLAWLYVTGHWPNLEIDHVNCQPWDNRFSNLREATRQQNSFNLPPNKRNTSGVKGVSWSKERKKWVAMIRVDNKYRSLGRFKTKEEAIDAYARVATQYHGEFARLGAQ